MLGAAGAASVDGATARAGTVADTVGVLSVASAAGAMAEAGEAVVASAGGAAGGEAVAVSVGGAVGGGAVVASVDGAVGWEALAAAGIAGACVVMATGASVDATTKGIEAGDVAFAGPGLSVSATAVGPRSPPVPLATG